MNTLSPQQLDRMIIDTRIKNARVWLAVASLAITAATGVLSIIQQRRAAR